MGTWAPGWGRAGGPLGGGAGHTCVALALLGPRLYSSSCCLLDPSLGPGEGLGLINFPFCRLASVSLSSNCFCCLRCPFSATLCFHGQATRTRTETEFWTCTTTACGTRTPCKVRNFRTSLLLVPAVHSHGPRLMWLPACDAVCVLCSLCSRVRPRSLAGSQGFEPAASRMRRLTSPPYFACGYLV